MQAEEDKEETDEERITLMIKRAILAIQENEFDKAEQILHVALKAAQDAHHGNGVTYIFDVMANLALRQEKYNDAEKLFVAVLKRILQDGTTQDSNEVVEISLKLANIFASRGEKDKAISGFSFCIATMDAKINNDKDSTPDNDEDSLLLWAMSHDWFARYLLSLNQYDEAAKHWKLAYDMCVRVNGPHHPQGAVLLNDLGSVASLQNKYDEAIDLLKQAVDVGIASESEDLATYYVNLGTVYLQRESLDDADRSCYMGKKVAERTEKSEVVQEADVCLKEIKELKKKMSVKNNKKKV